MWKRDYTEKPKPIRLKKKYWKYYNTRGCHHSSYWSYYILTLHKIVLKYIILSVGFFFLFFVKLMCKMLISYVRFVGRF